MRARELAKRVFLVVGTSLRRSRCGMVYTKKSIFVLYIKERNQIYVDVVVGRQLNVS